MASVAFHHFNQFREHGKVKLFGEYGGYGPGIRSRDFVFVDDVVAVNLWFLQNPAKAASSTSAAAAALQRRGRGHRQRGTHPEGEAPLPLAELVSRALVSTSPSPRRWSAVPNYHAGRS